MKRVVCILVAMVLMISVACHATGETSRKDFAVELRKYSVEMMKSFRNYYDNYPNSFDEACLVALYNYYMIYRKTSELYTAESAITLGNVGRSLIDKKILLANSNAILLLERKWNEWLADEYSLDNITQLLLMFVDGAIEAEG